MRKPKRASYEELTTSTLTATAVHVVPTTSSIPDFDLTVTAVSGVVPDDTFTVDEAVNAFGFGRLQVKLSLITGLCWMADAMEMTILSILSPALYCEFQIDNVKQAGLTTVVFLAMMISSALWAQFSNRHGRKTALLISAILIFIFGCLSSISPSYIWLLFLRGMVGLAVGCVPQSVTLYAEFIPMSQRGRSVVLLDSFWALGACFEVILALFVMPTLGWRWLLAFSSIPLLFFVVSSVYITESARFYAANNDYENAVATLKKIATENDKTMPLGRLILDDIQDVQKGSVRDLFLPEIRRTTLIFWCVWFSCAFCYYGIVLATTEIFRQTSNQTSNQSLCTQLSTKDYIDLLWTTLAEFPGIFVTVIIIEKLGRKLTMVIELVAFSAFVVPLLACMSSRTALTFLLFAARACISAVFQAAYVYTPEVYPPALRAIGLTMCSSLARLGAMATPFIAQLVLKWSVEWTVAVYAGVGLLGAVLTFLLPHERAVTRQ